MGREGTQGLGPLASRPAPPRAPSASARPLRTRPYRGPGRLVAPSGSRGRGPRRPLGFALAQTSLGARLGRRQWRRRGGDARTVRGPRGRDAGRRPRAPGWHSSGRAAGERYVGGGRSARIRGRRPVRRGRAARGPAADGRRRAGAAPAPARAGGAPREVTKSVAQEAPARVAGRRRPEPPGARGARGPGPPPPPPPPRHVVVARRRLRLERRARDPGGRPEGHAG